VDPTRTAATQAGAATRADAGLSGAMTSGLATSGLARPRLARHVRLTFCQTRKRPILLLPETVVVLHGSGADILELCDGRRTVAEIVAELGARYQTVPDDEVRRFLGRLVARRWVEFADG
jgi:pyrroloquinoline quinone biosynthesis protein D